MVHFFVSLLNKPTFAVTKEANNSLGEWLWHLNNNDKKVHLKPSSSALSAPPSSLCIIHGRQQDQMCMLPVQLPGEHIQRHMLVPLSERRCASTHYLLGTVIKSASLTPRLQLNWLPLVALVIHLIQAMRKPGCCFVCVQYTGCFGTCWWKKCGLHQLTFFIARRVAEWQGFWEACKTSACHSQQIITEVTRVIIMAAFGPAPPEHRSLDKDHLLGLLPSWSNKYISCEETLLWGLFKSASPNSSLQTSFLFLPHCFSLCAVSLKDLCTDSFPFPPPRQAVTSVHVEIIFL